MYVKIKILSIKELIFLSETQIEKSIRTASASLEMEGFSVDERAKLWCKKLLNKEITMDEYISLVKAKAGVLG